MSRRLLVGAAGAGAAVLARALWWEPRRAVVHEVALAPPAWPPALDGLRVAVIADLHTGAPYVDVPRVRRIVGAVNAAQPDLVALLGDYVDPEVRGGQVVAPEAVAEALAALRAPLGVVAVLGNHDWGSSGTAMWRSLDAVGIRVLENGAVDVGRGLWVAGVADATLRIPHVPRALQDVPDGATVLLLSHDPDVFPQVPPHVALTISGHTHGAQADLPLLRGRVIPSLYGTRYQGGHVVEAGRHLFISRGIGTSRLPVRFRARPEVPVLRLHQGATTAADAQVASA